MTLNFDLCQKLGVHLVVNFITMVLMLLAVCSVYQNSPRNLITIWYTNHSLWTTAITCIFRVEFEENVIAKMSGHRSL